MSVVPPTYRTPQIADVGDDLARQFHEIEACALRGVLTAMREVESYSPLITDALWQILAWPEQHPGPAAACAKREEWFAAAVRRFQHALQPGRISFEVVSRGQNSWMRVFHQGEKVSIRVGQMVAQRRWGAHYWSRNSAVDLEIAHSTIQGALNRFQSDVACSNRCRGALQSHQRPPARHSAWRALGQWGPPATSSCQRDSRISARSSGVCRGNSTRSRLAQAADLDEGPFRTIASPAGTCRIAVKRFAPL